jgi:hypothetical protein
VTTPAKIGAEQDVPPTPSRLPELEIRTLDPKAATSGNPLPAAL